MESKDLLYNFRDKIEKKRRRKNIIISLIVILFLFTGFNVWNNKKVDIKSYDVQNINIPTSFNGYKILQISDVFSKDFGKNNKTILEIVDIKKPDIVVLTGNIISKDKDFKNYLLNLKNNIKQPIYYVLGDEEMSLDEKDKKDFIGFLEENNIYLLNGKRLALMSGGENIYLYGAKQELEDYSYNFKDSDSRPRVENSGFKNEAEDFNIMISHNPDYARVYADENYDLILSGLKTGGIIRLPGLGGLAKAKNVNNLDYQAGRYWVEDSLLIVSKGMSSNRYKRVFNRPEIVEINLYGRAEVDNGKK